MAKEFVSVAAPVHEGRNTVELVSLVAKRIVKRSLGAVGLEVHRRKTPNANAQRNGASSSVEINQVMPDVNKYAGLRRLINTRTQQPLALIGTSPALRTYGAFLEAQEIEWEWDPDIDLPDGVQVVVCEIPLSAEHWSVMRKLKQRYGARVTGIQELTLPFTPIMFAQDKLKYYSKSLDEIVPYYLGEKWWGPIDKLNELFPLSGKRVIEFGPFDGAQTAGLMHHGVRELVCIEARAENFIKTLIAKEVFDWNGVRLVMDDMHNADAIKYGRFDLAFCHGTYYHSISPFVLLENLVSLSDKIFLGGYVLEEGAPFETAMYEGEGYRVQRFQEQEGNFTAGVNKSAYYFHPDDLTRFFSIRGYDITPMADIPVKWASNRMYQFFASKAING